MPELPDFFQSSNPLSLSILFFFFLLIKKKKTLSLSLSLARWIEKKKKIKGGFRFAFFGLRLSTD